MICFSSSCSNDIIQKWLMRLLYFIKSMSFILLRIICIKTTWFGSSLCSLYYFITLFFPNVLLICLNFLLTMIFFYFRLARVRAIIIHIFSSHQSALVNFQFLLWSILHILLLLITCLIMIRLRCSRPHILASYNFRLLLGLLLHLLLLSNMSAQGKQLCVRVRFLCELFVCAYYHWEQRKLRSFWICSVLKVGLISKLWLWIDCYCLCGVFLLD